MLVPEPFCKLFRFDSNIGNAGRSLQRATLIDRKSLCEAAMRHTLRWPIFKCCSPIISHGIWVKARCCLPTPPALFAGRALVRKWDRCSIVPMSRS